MSSTCPEVLPGSNQGPKGFSFPTLFMSGGWTYLLFPASAVRHAWFPVISRNSIYPMFTKFGMGVYCVNLLRACMGLLLVKIAL